MKTIPPNFSLRKTHCLLAAVSLPLLMALPHAFAGADAVSALIEKNLAEYKVPGAVVVVVEDGKITHLRGYGVRDIEQKAPVDPDTIFQLASVTKTFAAATYGAAVDAGALRWEQPAREVFPEFRLHCPYATKWANGIDLLVHRTGMPPFVGGFYEALGFTREEVLERIPLIEPTASFRERPQYSNICYFLAGETAAASLKTTWTDLLREKILLPLKMNRTGISGDILGGDGNVARPYILEPDGSWRKALSDTQPVLLAAGAMASTGRNLANYLQMLLAEGRFEDRVVLSPESLETIFTPVVAEEPGFAEMAPIGRETGFSYTPGWGIFYYNGNRILEKGGALPGFRTLICVVPDRNWGVAILSNLNFTAFPEAVRAALLEQKLGGIPGRDFAKEIREQWKTIGDLIGAPPKAPTNPTPASLPLSSFAGTYSSLDFGVWNVFEKEGVLEVRAGPAGYAGSLSHFDGNQFLCSWNAEVASVDKFDFQIQDNSVVGFVFDGEFRFTRHEPPATTPAPAR